MSNENSVVIVVVPSENARHVKGKNNGKDWYVQRAGLQAKDGLTEPFEIWHQKQDQILAAGQYTLESGGGYVTDQRLNVRPRFVPVTARK